MTVDEALEILEIALEHRSLSHVYELVFRRSWQGQTYNDIAREAGYDYDYIKEVGSKLWNYLSEALGERVNKKNVQLVLRRYHKHQQEEQAVNIETATLKNVNDDNGGDRFDELSLPNQDWRGAPDVSRFYGRTDELVKLERWIIQDFCRIVAIVGMGGIGKTALSVTLAEELQIGFQYIVWRSLRNAPPLMDLLIDIIHHISDRQGNLPDTPYGCISTLIECLGKHRCLVVLDHADALLSSGTGREYRQAGEYIEGRENYAELFRAIAEAQHQSCLLITSREQPREIALQEGARARSLFLGGLQVTEAQRIFAEKGEFEGTEQDWQFLVARYAGNPLALKAVALAVKEFFGGDIAQLNALLAEDRWIFSDIRKLLDQQFDRLSELEKKVIYWVTLQEGEVTLADLKTELAPVDSTQRLLETLDSLRRRSLIDKNGAVFSQQPIVREYIEEKMNQQSLEAADRG
ncbi:WD repeat-containing protein [Thalassoporum mexicanum PCC 7367]|uniref:NB-ARC domain-containing protein n=1 Tax=Thalassoporum mexicanum TaxID=3457544 RepID=UPI00029FEF12|nr:NB-ARC domain-containing protein [Pseudanabaena sp. PCC 7367]AFY71772.1 WD repeat-containing protein [Pseudanabaena sp. PCC 7367]